MTPDDRTATSTRDRRTGAFPPWWFVPALIAGGQLLMRLTGYSAWAASVGQEFMFSVIFYMAIVGVLLGGWSVIQLHKRSP